MLYVIYLINQISNEHGSRFTQRHNAFPGKVAQAPPMPFARTLRRGLPAVELPILKPASSARDPNDAVLPKPPFNGVGDGPLLSPPPKDAAFGTEPKPAMPGPAPNAGVAPNMAGVVAPTPTKLELLVWLLLPN